MSRTFHLEIPGVVFYGCLSLAVIGFGVYFDQVAQLRAPTPVSDAVFEAHADLERARASAEVNYVAQWAIQSRDPAGLPFVIVDKAQARLYAFDAAGRLKGSSPVLLGAMRGDGAAAPLTPAGRFVADALLSAQGDGIVWVNGSTVLALHGGSTGLASAPGRSSKRLASLLPQDKRISDGSLHVSQDFYRSHLQSLSAGAVAYVLPEASRVEEVFGARARAPDTLAGQKTPNSISSRTILRGTPSSQAITGI